LTTLQGALRRNRISTISSPGQQEPSSTGFTSSLARLGAGWAGQALPRCLTSQEAPGTKTDTKWADGAAVLSGSVGVLLEVKTVPARNSVPGPTIKKIPADLAALVSANWQQTLQQAPDNYSGVVWTERRAEMESVYGLQLALVHGDVDVAAIDAGVRAGIEAGIATLAYRYRNPYEPPWLKIVREALLGEERRGGSSAATTPARCSTRGALRWLPHDVRPRAVLRPGPPPRDVAFGVRSGEPGRVRRLVLSLLS
jgi:hypothetical protein